MIPFKIVILNLKHNTWYTHFTSQAVFFLFTCGTIIWRSSSISFLVLPSFLLFLTFPAFPVPAIISVSRGFGATTIHDSTRNFTTWNWRNDNTINKQHFVAFQKIPIWGFLNWNWIFSFQNFIYESLRYFNMLGLKLSGNIEMKIRHFQFWQNCIKTIEHEHGGLNSFNKDITTDLPQMN